MKLLVGIPTHRRPDLLRKCLDSIAAQKGDLPEVSVFVADNDALRREGAEVVDQLTPSFRFPLSSTVVEEPGISAVRNAILDEARRSEVDFIAMIDDDETASEEWLSGLLRVQAEYGADLVGGIVFFDVQEDRWFDGAFWTDNRAAGPTDLLFATNNVLISTAFLHRMTWPLFDPAFGLTGGGDLEWFTRLKKLGAKACWSRDAKVSEVVPPERRTMAWFLRRNFRVGVNELQIARMHWRARGIAWLLIKAGASIGLLPLYALGLFSREFRYDVLRKWARATGRFSALLGFQYVEYAVRHESRRQS